MRPPAAPRQPPKPAVSQPQLAVRPAVATSRTVTTARPAASATATPDKARVSARPAAPRVPSKVPGKASGKVSGAMKARLAERRAMTRHRAWRAIAIWAGSVAAAAGLGWVVFFSQLLALDPAQITVTGQGTTVSVQEVHAVVAAEAGVPMARINTTELRQEILGLTGVKDAAISRAWPRGMTVEVTARVPVAVIVTAEGFTLVDDEAVYVGVVADLPPGLPLIDVGVSDSGPLLAALRVWAGLPTDLAQQVTGITAATRDDVQMTLSNGTTVHWGSEERIALKVATVKTLLLQAPEAQVIDVSSPELPVTR